MEKRQRWVMTFFILLALVGLLLIFMPEVEEEVRKEEMEMSVADAPEVMEITRMTGMDAQLISLHSIECGIAPRGFKALAGTDYRPSFNEDPAIPAQCWIETGYGTQNACKYCHTDSLALSGHGNNSASGKEQVLFSFPTPRLNSINWKNITHPQEIVQRLASEGIPIPDPSDDENLVYIRTDNWREAYARSRATGDDTWNNLSHSDSPYQLIPALNPDNLYPWKEGDPSDGGRHGYIDQRGFVTSALGECTGWRAVNFFPYALFTPLTGSVGGTYIRLPEKFRTLRGKMDRDTYIRNLDLLERGIKNQEAVETHYYGDASGISFQSGFYPVGTEFARPLHYVDLNADGETGPAPDGVAVSETAVPEFEFPGTRSKRLKEIRYMYKWKPVTLEEIAPKERKEKSPAIVGKEWRGWIDNGAGWILAGFIENRGGALRPQTTEEMLQCLGCHSLVGNTVDSVWSFQRKIPGDTGWGEMNYGFYSKQDPTKTRLNDYYQSGSDGGEMEDFYASVVGADLFGVMPAEIRSELIRYADDNGLVTSLQLKHALDEIFDDEKLKMSPGSEREPILRERMLIMRRFAADRAYLYYAKDADEFFIKGRLFYPGDTLFRTNISAYRRIVLDQSFNLGKNVFGLLPDAIPFTFRSDGTVLNSRREPIPRGDVISGRPFGEDGVGVTPTGLTPVDAEGRPVDEKGDPVDITRHPERAAGHVSRGGTLDTRYSPILTSRKVRREKEKNASTGQ